MTEIVLNEANRSDTTELTLAKVRPAFRPDGTTTAGNAPGVNAAAAAMLVTLRNFAEQHGISPMLAIRGSAVAGVEPDFFGLAPIPAICKAQGAGGCSMEQRLG